MIQYPKVLTHTLLAEVKRAVDDAERDWATHGPHGFDDRFAVAYVVDVYSAVARALLQLVSKDSSGAAKARADHDEFIDRLVRYAYEKKVPIAARSGREAFRDRCERTPAFALKWTQVIYALAGPDQGLSRTPHQIAAVAASDRPLADRAKRLKSIMQERGLTSYRLHKLGGPDKKTLNKVLRGEKVTDHVLTRIAAALSNDGGSPVSIDDIR